MILQRMSSLHWNHLTLYRLSTRVADNSFSKISHTSAYLEITSLQVHFQLVVRKRFHIFFILPRNIRRKSVPFSYFFFRLCIQELKVLYITRLHAVSSTLNWDQNSCKDLSSEEDNFPSLNNFFFWTLRRSL